MTLEKAIEVLENLLTNLPQVPPQDRREAILLGILALEEIGRVREGTAWKDNELLPGETE